MSDLDQITQTIQQTFEHILQHNMQGIPILNPAIKVQVLGFQHWQGRVLGVVITPWMMNLVLLPGDDEDWSQMELGHKQPHEFPSRSYKFMVNDIEGIGPCQTYSMCSPMREFSSHQQAVQVAQDFLDGLMEETEQTEEERVDEELLGRVMRGEATPEIDMEQFDDINAVSVDSEVSVEKNISRRNLLRGNLTG
jgi:[NiFe] hydrogenase assembly HybE family chaperone